MRLLLAVDHTEMQSFFSKDYRVEAVENVDSVQALYETIKYAKADVLILSRYLSSCEDPRQVVEHIKTVKPELKIVYLYGQQDKETNAFIEYLLKKNILHYHIGVDISSLELNRLLFDDEQQFKGSIRSIFKNKSKPIWIKKLDKAVITIYSNASNGKSYLAWNLASALGQCGYKTALINIDRGYSANLYFGIENIYYDLFDYYLQQNAHKMILDHCWKRGNLSIVTGSLGNEEQLSNTDFQKLLYYARSMHDIVIIDTYTGLADTTLQAINQSTIDLFIFDTDLMHFHLNKLMLDKLEDVFLDSKTYAVINNCNTNSQAYKYIYAQINNLNVQFKDILHLSNCGSLGNDLMSTGKSPYEHSKSSSLNDEINHILVAIKARNNGSMIRKMLMRGEK